MSRDPLKTWQTYIRAINFIFLILDYDFRVLIPPNSDFAQLEIDHTIFRVITKWYALKPVPKKWFCSKLKMYFQATIFIQTEEKYDGSNLL